MRLFLPLLPLLLLGALPADAQTVSNPHDGAWTASWPGASRPLQAAVVVNGNTGSWKTFAANSGNPCVGREAPIAVTHASADELRFTAKFSEVISTCENFEVDLRRDGDVLKGTRGKLPVEFRRK